MLDPLACDIACRALVLMNSALLLFAAFPANSAKQTNAEISSRAERITIRDFTSKVNRRSR